MLHFRVSTSDNHCSAFNLSFRLPLSILLDRSALYLSLPVCLRGVKLAVCGSICFAECLLFTPPLILAQSSFMRSRTPILRIPSSLPTTGNGIILFPVPHFSRLLPTARLLHPLTKVRALPSVACYICLLLPSVPLHPPHPFPLLLLTAVSECLLAHIM